MHIKSKVSAACLILTLITLLNRLRTCIRITPVHLFLPSDMFAKNCYSPQGSWEENAWELMGINCTHSCEFFSSGCCKHTFRSFHSSFSAKEMEPIPWCYFSSLTGFSFSPCVQSATEPVTYMKTGSRTQER